MEFRDAHNQMIEVTGYPTEKNLNLLRLIVGASSGAGDLVLDCFMGSGTTGVACVKLSRKFIGIEKREDYFDIACRRIDDAQRQGNLFVPTYTQERLI